MNNQLIKLVRDKIFSVIFSFCSKILFIYLFVDSEESAAKEISYFFPGVQYRRMVSNYGTEFQKWRVNIQRDI